MIKWFFLLLFTCSLSALEPKDIPIIPFPNNKPLQRKTTLCLCGMFKNEAPFLKEWIEFHRIVGVKHFYLYNNCSTDDFLTVLKPYIDKGIVELFDVPFDSTLYTDFAKTHNFVQVCCYNDAIQRTKIISEWLAIIDSDEFICPVKEKDIPAVLSHFDYAGGLVIYWQLYGTSQVKDLASNELMVEKLLYKFPADFGENRLYKSIVKPQFATCTSPHSCKYKKKHCAYTPDRKRFTYQPKWSTPPIDTIRINHYTFRTESFYYNVKKPRRINWGYNPSDQFEKERLNLSNSVYDPVMLRFVPKMRKRMAEK